MVDKNGFTVVFQEALDFLKQKVALPTHQWNDLRHQAHDRAFMVAGATKEALLSDLQAAILKGFEEGQTTAWFKDQFAGIVEKHGWSYKGSLGWRSKIIYETNIRTMQAAGRLKQMRSPATAKLYPFWKYKHGMHRYPEKPRASHVQWDGVILAMDDPWWDTHYPPCDWQCSCGVRPMMRSQVKTELEANGKTIRDLKAPEIVWEYRKDTATGDMIKVPQGIGIGWGYQPGDMWERGLVPPQLQVPLAASNTLESDARGSAVADNLPAIVDIAKPLQAPILKAGLQPEEYVNAFLEEFGATRQQAKLWRDPSGNVVLVSEELFKDASGKLKVQKRGRDIFVKRLAEALKDPDEIWVDWEQFGDKKRTSTLRRRYIRFDPDGSAITVFEWGQSGWNGVTAHVTDDLNKIKETIMAQRHGVLLYRRTIKDK